MAQNLPDAEILFRTWAASQTSITDLVSTRIATRLPNSGTLPFLVFHQFSYFIFSDVLINSYIVF